MRVAAAVVMGCVWDASNQDSGLRENCRVCCDGQNTRTSQMKLDLFYERQVCDR